MYHSQELKDYHYLRRPSHYFHDCSKSSHQQISPVLISHFPIVNHHTTFVHAPTPSLSRPPLVERKNSTPPQILHLQIPLPDPLPKPPLNLNAHLLLHPLPSRLKTRPSPNDSALRPHTAVERRATFVRWPRLPNTSAQQGEDASFPSALAV